MKKRNQKRVIAKNSNNNSSSLMVLREALRNGGSVTYHFVREEIVRISGESKTIEKESYLKTNLSNLVVFNSKNERNTPDQILQILRDTCSDLGANYFTIQSNT